MLAALAALIALSAYFSATETAFTSLNRIRLKTRADDGDKRAARTLALAADYDRLLSTLLIGNNIVNNVATTIGAVLFIKLIGSAKGPTVSATVLTVVILVFGEVTPKSLAKERPEAWAIAATPLLRVLAVVLTPVNFLFTQWKKLLRVLLRHQDDDGITEEELMGMVDQAETEGSLDQHESDLIRNAIEFNDMEVSEILTPRVDLEALADTATMEEADTVITAVVGMVGLKPTLCAVGAGKDIADVIIVHSDGSQEALGLGGYLDIGLIDTMKDLMVNFLGAVVFSIIGYFYVKEKGKGDFAAQFIPKVKREKKDEA